MFDRIVIGWDATPGAETALAWARREYADLPAVLVRVAPRLEHGDVATERSELIDLSERLRESDRSAEIGVRAEEGSVIDVLDDYLHPGTLIVLGAPRRRHHSRWGIGPRLAGRRGGGAVVIVPADGDAGSRQSVVAGFDGSQASMTAVEDAADEARRRGLTLEVVHAWQDPRGWSPGIVDYLDDVRVYEDVHRQMLDEAVEHIQARYQDTRGRLEFDEPARAITRIGRGAALVVVAPHGAGAVSRFLLGSVTHDLMLDPPAPLMIVTLPAKD